ncbi:MAG: ATP-binding protein [Deltaproteobacteria bacterium]|nr:ATP-binding protein [Deltaproteobacteria bacterium]
MTPGEHRSHPPKAESTRLEFLTGQALKKIRERQRIREISRPGDARCKRCHQGFSPSWDHLEGRWKYPGMAEDGICRRCKRLIHIREYIEQYLVKAGVPPKYMKCSFENFKVTGENRQSFGLCKGYVSGPDYTLFIYGNYGVGKTHMAVAITRELLLQGRQVAFTSVPRLLFEIRKSFRAGSEVTEEYYISRYTSYEYLVLDDFGVEKTTEWARQTLDYIIYERDNNLKPMVITSNLSLDEIAEKIDGRISSRLAGMGKVIQLKGSDYRLRRVKPGTRPKGGESERSEDK